MADPTSSNIDDFLGVKPAPAWQRYVKWVLVGIGVILLLLLARSWFAGPAKGEYATEQVARGSLSVTVSAGPYFEHHGGTGVRATTGLNFAF